MPKINVEQERTTQLLSELAEIIDNPPAAIIEWYDALVSADRVRLLKGLAVSMAQLQAQSYVLMRASYVFMGIMARGENADNN